MSHPMSEPSAPKTKRSRRWRWLLGLAVLLLAGLGIYRWFQPSAADLELQVVIAELDRTDPHWRLEDLEAQREEIPDEENAALVVLAALEKFPPYQRSETEAPRIGLHFIPPPYQLEEKQVEWLRDEMKRFEEAVQEARKLLHMPKGRFAVQWPDHGILREQDSRTAHAIAYLLEYDTLLFCQLEQSEKAWESAIAVLHVGTSVGDEPGSHWNRRNGRNTATLLMERILAQGQVDADTLAATQEILKNEAAVPLLEILLRGNRALEHRLFTQLGAGDREAIHEAHRHMGRPMRQQYWWHVPDYVDPESAKIAHALMLQFQSKAIAIARLPATEQMAAFANLDQEAIGLDTAEAPVAVRWVLNAPWTFHASECLYLQAKLHCTLTGLACERFRLTHKRWPTSLQELVDEKLLETIPIDPFNGKPLSYLQDTNGINIYSVGCKTAYNGKSLNPPRPGSLIEFRLWNLDQRRQQARTREELEELHKSFKR